MNIMRREMATVKKNTIGSYTQRSALCEMQTSLNGLKIRHTVEEKTSRTRNHLN